MKHGKHLSRLGTNVTTDGKGKSRGGVMVWMDGGMLRIMKNHVKGTQLSQRTITAMIVVKLTRQRQLSGLIKGVWRKLNGT